MVFSGSVVLLFGVIGVVTSFINRTTKGWSSTRLKFVITSWGLLVGGIVIIAVGLLEVQLFYRDYRF